MDLLFRVACNGGNDEPLNIHLKRITDSAYTRKTLGGNAVDGQYVAPVIAESHDGECRREIMRHIRECLSADASGKRWQKIYGGLTLTEIIMEHGSHELAIEVAHGHHFDLVQKVSFLEQFDAAARGCTDRRAQILVRTKASEVKAMLVPLLEKASTEELPENAGLNAKDANGPFKDTASLSTTSGSGPSSSMSPTSSIPTPDEAIPRAPAATELVRVEQQPAVTSGISTIQECEEFTESRIPRKESVADIDEAFSSLREWMDSAGYTSASSAAHSPRDSCTDESDCEPLGQFPAKVANGRSRNRTMSAMSACSVGSDAFFSPMPTPAHARGTAKAPAAAPVVADAPSTAAAATGVSSVAAVSTDAGAVAADYSSATVNADGSEIVIAL